MDEKIKEINVLGELFSDSKVNYQIPLYQRAFEWKNSEIEQLIDDIDGINLNENINYFLGSIIVAKRPNCYEVIDGQQRLTALYILFNALNIDVATRIGFDGREKANRTLQEMKNNQLNKLCSSEIELLDANILQGKNIVIQKIAQNETKQKDFKKNFIEKLKKVKLYRIEVPEHTDLNRYFEIMNTRGAQLEQQDIVKAMLMSDLNNFENEQKLAEHEGKLFNIIWTACSDMNCYVQTKFDTKLRNELFGREWNKINWREGNLLDSRRFNDIENDRNTKFNEKYTIDYILMLDKYEIDNKNTIKQLNDRIRFESIITFPYFLLYVLRTYVEKRNINVKLNDTLDDKKLINDFKIVRNSFENNTRTFSIDFIEFLLKSRILFDKYIVKREFINDDIDGQWSLKEIKAIYTNRKTNFEFINTRISNYDENLMLQACCRVSYTSPKSMNWIRELISYLYEKSENGIVYENYLKQIEKDVQKACKLYLQTENYDLGVGTPHIIFNYLDYLLWKQDFKDGNNTYKDFKFEYRNSVEHWYPQHPIGEKEGGFEDMTNEEGLNNIGNLCLVQNNINSKFSNMAPSSKKGTFKELTETGSLKLRKMAELTQNKDNMNADEYWKRIAYKKHGEECIKLLKSECFIEN